MKHYMTFMQKQTKLRNGWLEFKTAQELQAFGEKIEMMFAFRYKGKEFNPVFFPDGKLTEEFVLENYKPKFEDDGLGGRIEVPSS